MTRNSVLCALAAILLSGECVAQQVMEHGRAQTETAATMDTRELLKLSPMAIDGLRADMRDMMAALANVLDLLAAGKRAEASKALEDGLGMTAMSTHPGMMKASAEFPEGARMLGMNTHQAASALARNLAKATPDATFAGLQSVVAGCTSCHMTYRVR